MKKYIIGPEAIPRLVVLKREKGNDKGEFSLSSIQEFLGKPEFDYLFAYLDTVSHPKSTGIFTSTLLALFALLKK